MALVHAGDYWRDQQAVRADMELEAQRDPFIESNLAMLRAHIALVDLYWSGQLVHGVDPIPEVSHTLGSEQITLEREQQQVVEAIGERVALALYWAKGVAMLLAAITKSDWARALLLGVDSWLPKFTLLLAAPLAGLSHAWRSALSRWTDDLGL